MGEYEAFFDRCGQALVFLVHVFLHRETQHGLLQAFSAMLTNFAVTNTQRKAVKPGKFGELKTSRTI